MYNHADTKEIALANLNGNTALVSTTAFVVTQHMAQPVYCRGCNFSSLQHKVILSQVKALNGLIREVTGIKPHAFWKPMEANGESSEGRKTGVALKRPNKKKYRKGLPWQRHNGFGHRIRKFCVKYALLRHTSPYAHTSFFSLFHFLRCAALQQRADDAP